MQHTPTGASFISINSPDGGAVICFSYLRWASGADRPQQMMRRSAGALPVYFWEEPRIVAGLDAARLDIATDAESGVHIVVPQLREEDDLAGDAQTLARLLDRLTSEIAGPVIHWYCDPAMLAFSDHVRPACIVYDRLDDPADRPHLEAVEARVSTRADQILTDGEAGKTAPASEAGWDTAYGLIAARIEEFLREKRRVQPIVSPTRGPSEPPARYDVMVVGAGIAGAVMAERLASQSGKSVLVVDRRPHVADNADNLLDHPGIDLLLGVEYKDARSAYPHDHLVFTGPIDDYFDHCHGRLQDQSSRAIDSPPAGELALFKRYEALALAESGVTFVGRPAADLHHDRDRVVGQALATYRRLAASWALPAPAEFEAALA
ncbi:NAD(P)-binding protein [Sphingomonas aliaeris]|uniref:NAD(P)-binding protein n=1 Tax=Sphingomonas aliaeris TaxID=2759526 RepID=A0A974NTC5_9SPHN|nr:UDP-galactopyranose mutase [Sphingomonas aliaeris]QQV76639.1 NAD(P)-binding protein [Sphingomonas aliaeris]